MTLKTVNIKGKEYVEVNERIKHFRSSEAFKDYSLSSEWLKLENGVAICKAIIKNGEDRVVAE